MSAYLFYKENKGKDLPIFKVLRNFVAGTNIVTQAEINLVKEPVEP